ncbi:Fc receptor-like protein 5 [Hoplias malabaricus]|uniref:Fc receptor-like protein 5 n=1 Tax=Hoplias malabaricus TaxID=27720 RepID=UPI0034638166
MSESPATRRSPKSPSPQAWLQEIPTLRVEPEGSVFTGDTVTLSCETQSTGAEIFWWKDTQYFSPDLIHKDSNTTTVRVTVSDPGETRFRCMGKWPQSSYYSNTTKITVRGTISEWLYLPAERQKPTVKVQPAESVFIGERVTLTCETGGGYDWNYEWNKNNQVLRSFSRKEYTIRNVERQKPTVKVQPAESVFIGERVTLTCETGGGGYWNYECLTQVFIPVKEHQAKYTHTSDAVTLTVSDKPRPTLTSSLKVAVLTGNTVTLYCSLGPSAGWTFYWSKHTQNPENNSRTYSYTIRSVRLSDGGRYWCRAGRGDPVYYTHYSDALWVNVTDNPKAILSIKPDTHVFKGETVTLRCDIREVGDTEWTYSWFKDFGLYLSSETQENTIHSVTESNSSKYTCRGEMENQNSEISDAVTLTVSGEFQAVLSVSPQSWLTEGDSVTLSCEVPGSAADWTFSWYRAVAHRQGLSPVTDAHGTVMYYVELLSDSRRGAGGSYTLSPAALNHTGVYVCGAERGEPVYHTQHSRPHPLWITGKSPPVSLIISPSRTQHFSADSLSLSCEGQRDSTGWRVKRYTHGEVSDCSTDTGFTCNISSLSTSYTGVYWCQSESGEGSDPVNVTVYNGDVILESPVHPVTEGDPLTLRCLFRSTKSSPLPADFYKNGSLLQNQTTGEMTIHKVSRSDEGLYHCKHPERGESPQSWISVRKQTEEVRAVLLAIIIMCIFSDNPKAILSIKPDTHVFKGETVTLRCDIRAVGDTEWTYSWFKDDGLYLSSETQENTIHSVTESNSSKYTCRGEMENQNSEISDAVTLTVSGKSPPVSLIISPSRTQHFSADSLSLSCEGQRDSTGWRVERYTRGEVSDCSTDTGFTCNISSLSTSYTGVYWCQSESGEGRDPVNVTVYNGDVILESPVHPVTEGDPLTLRCLFRSTKSSHLPVDFYKNGSLLQNQTTGEMTIHKVSRSDEGLYHCKHPEKGESPQSWISVRKQTEEASGSGSTVVTVAVGLSVFLLLIIILGIFCCYKKKKGLKTKHLPVKHKHTFAVSVNQKYLSKVLRGIMFFLIHGDSVVRSDDVTYTSVVTIKNKESKRNDDAGEILNSVTYSEIKSSSKGHGNDGAGPSDGVYAEIELRPKKNKGDSCLTFKGTYTAVTAQFHGCHYEYPTA